MTERRNAPPVLNTLDQLAMALARSGDGHAGGDVDRYPFAKRLLEAIAAAVPSDLARLRFAFPRAVTAYELWMEGSAPPVRDSLLARVDAELAAQGDLPDVVTFPGGMFVRKGPL